MATRQFSGEFDLGDASRADISEISFPSHVSGLESFSDFDKTFPAFCDEKPPDHNTGPGGKTGWLVLSSSLFTLNIDLNLIYFNF